MSKHTPGPWRVQYDHRLAIVGPRDEIGWPVIVVYNAGMPNDDTALANAALIAAAPDLIRALMDAIALLEVYTSPAGKYGPNATTRGQATATIEEARAAIAKATPTK